MVQNKQIIYTEEFVNLVRETFKDTPGIISMAETGDYAIGEILDELSDHQITPENIIDAFDSPNSWRSMHDLYVTARRMKNVNLLHGMWLERISEVENATDRTISATKEGKTQ